MYRHRQSEPGTDGHRTQGGFITPGASLLRDDLSTWIRFVHTDIQRGSAAQLPAAHSELICSSLFCPLLFQVHCDPHAGNILVTRRGPRDNRPRIVLLDHGLYKELDDPFRLSYAHLWQSLIRGDHEGIKRYAAEMNAGAMYALFASMLTRKSYTDITNVNKSKEMNNLVLKSVGQADRKQASSDLLSEACSLDCLLSFFVFFL